MQPPEVDNFGVGSSAGFSRVAEDDAKNWARIRACQATQSVTSGIVMSKTTIMTAIAIQTKIIYVVP